MRGPIVAGGGLSVPVANRLGTMQVLPHHRSKLRIPTEISLLGKGREPCRGRGMLALPPDAARRRARPPLRRRASSASSAATCGASRRARPWSCTPPSTSAPSRPRRSSAPRRLTRPRPRTRLTAAVDPVTSTITIGRPREEVFDYLADIANHPEFCDHYLKDWRLTRVDSVGRGAGARFRRDKRLDRFGWERHDLHRGRAAVPDRGRRARREVQPQQDLHDVDAVALRRRHARSSTRRRSSRKLATDRFMEVVRHARAGSSAAAARRCGACSRSSRRTTTAASAPRSRASRTPGHEARLLVISAALLARSLAAGCGNKDGGASRSATPRASTSTSTT